MTATSFPQFYRRFYRRLRLDLWFPHVPLALAIGVAGALALLPAVHRYAQDYLDLQFQGLFNALHPISRHVPHLILRGVPNTVVGAMQVLIALGLLIRSRLAWVSAIVITLAELILALRANTGAALPFQAIYLLLLLMALYAARATFNRSSLAAGTLFAIAAILLLLLYGVLGSFLLGAGFSPPITTLPQAFYFAVVTMSTVGYGDITPKSNDARLFVVSLIIFGLTIFATALTAVIGPIVQSRIERSLVLGRKQMSRVNHYIITGDGALARNTARELRGRKMPVLVIVDSPDKTGFADAEVMVGDPTELDVLRSAGIESARALLALSDDDSENAFVILAARELVTDARKVAAVTNRKNLERVRRVNPDMIIAPSVVGGEILAMALTEEKIDGDVVLRRFLDVKTENV